VNKGLGFRANEHRKRSVDWPFRAACAPGLPVVSTSGFTHPAE